MDIAKVHSSYKQSLAPELFDLFSGSALQVASTSCWLDRLPQVARLPLITYPSTSPYTHPTYPTLGGLKHVESPSLNYLSCTKCFYLSTCHINVCLKLVSPNFVVICAGHHDGRKLQGSETAKWCSCLEVAGCVILCIPAVT